ncbi:unnamed protein product [Pieris macdunnoughi]|uniref:Distal membrane-arm assembly complex protein 1-like domain-containing protein n=1 Tax=Pieris macdunnoughi TaxID=345717 RepID=A0A821UUT1_9NEOP|nr:unnamed protein product [Pieris macdunnoughi]
MPSVVADRPRDCTSCRIVSAVGLIGIGGYLANVAWQNKTTAGKVAISTMSLAFVSLGIARYKQEYPFNKKDDDRIV